MQGHVCTRTLYHRNSFARRDTVKRRLFCTSITFSREDTFTRYFCTKGQFCTATLLNEVHFITRWHFCIKSLLHESYFWITTLLHVFHFCTATVLYEGYFVTRGHFCPMGHFRTASLLLGNIFARQNFFSASLFARFTLVIFK